MNAIGIKNKKRIVWITPDCFYDVDWPIVGGLIDYFDIRWYVLWSPNCKRSLPNDANITKFIRLKYSWLDPRSIWESYSITKMIGEEDAQLVYNGNNGFPAFFPFLFKRVPAEKIIYEGHEIDPYNVTMNDKLHVAYFMSFIRKVGLTQVFSRHTERLFLEMYPGKKCCYIPMVPKDYGEPRKLLSFDGKKVFLFFGTIRNSKRLDLLLDAFNMLDKNHQEKAVVLVYGKCWRSDPVLFEEKSKGNKDIILKMDFVPDDIVADLFASSHYLVQPYDWISQSGPTMIAFNYNTPIIASDIDGFTERIHDKQDGYLFHKGDVEDLKKVLEYCIDQSEDDYRQIKKNQAEFVKEEYSLPVVVAMYRQMLDNRISELEK